MLNIRDLIGSVVTKKKLSDCNFFLTMLQLYLFGKKLCPSFASFEFPLAKDVLVPS